MEEEWRKSGGRVEEERGKQMSLVFPLDVLWVYCDHTVPFALTKSAHINTDAVDTAVDTWSTFSSATSCNNTCIMKSKACVRETAFKLRARDAPPNVVLPMRWPTIVAVVGGGPLESG